MDCEIIFNENQNGIGNNINDVCIDTNKAVAKRAADFIEQIHNPYCFKCDGTLVRVMFNPKGANLEDSMLRYFSRLNQV